MQVRELGNGRNDTVFLTRRRAWCLAGIGLLSILYQFAIYVANERAGNVLPLQEGQKLRVASTSAIRLAFKNQVSGCLDQLSSQTEMAQRNVMDDILAAAINMEDDLYQNYYCAQLRRLLGSMLGLHLVLISIFFVDAVHYWIIAFRRGVVDWKSCCIRLVTCLIIFSALYQILSWRLLSVAFS